MYARTHLLLVNVDFDKLELRVFALELVEVGRDKLARSTPGRPVVDHDRLRAADLRAVSSGQGGERITDQLIKLRLAFNSLDHCVTLLLRQNELVIDRVWSGEGLREVVSCRARWRRYMYA